MAVTKLQIYNDALILLGQRVLTSDVEVRPNRLKLDALYDNGAVDYCLEVVQPKFAVTLASLTGVTPTLVTAYAQEATLPATFQSLVGVYADASMDQEVKRYTHEADKILSDFTPIFVRFVQDFATVGLTNMPQTFARVVGAYLARELSITLDPDETENMDAQLEARITISLERDTTTEPTDRGLPNVVLTDPWRKIYNDALQIMGLQRIASLSDDSQRKNAMDIAREAEFVEAALEDTSWHFGITSSQLFFNPAIEPAFGPRFAYDIPADLHRLDGIWADEYRVSPIKNYHDEGDLWFTDYRIIYIQFISKTFLTDPTMWPAYFKRFVAGKLARDVCGSIPNANVPDSHLAYSERRSEAMSTDAIQSPPTHLSEGTWARSRGQRYPSSDRNRP